MQPTPFVWTALGGHAGAGEREVTAKAFILEQYPIASYKLKALLPAPCRRSDIIAPFLPQPSKPTPPLRSDTSPPFWLFLLVQLSCTVHASSKSSRFPPPISNPVLSLTSCFQHPNPLSVQWLVRIRPAHSSGHTLLAPPTPCGGCRHWRLSFPGAALHSASII